MFGYSVRFLAGMVLLTTNQLVGWGGLALCTYLSKRTSNRGYILLGSGIYAVSWGMVALGVVLAGPESYSCSIGLIKAYFWQTVLIASLALLGAGVYAFRTKRIGAGAGGRRGRAPAAR